MVAAVLDASAVLAFVKQEPGADEVLPYIGRAAISAVNLQEVVKELTLDDVPPDAIRAILAELRLDVRPHDESAAYASGALVAATRRYGRGLGDRTCMALGMQVGVPVLTADREWKRVELEGLDLRHIR